MNWEESGLLPESVARDVLSATQEESAVLSLASTRPMPSGTERLPLVDTAPSAQWIDVGTRKPYSEVVWSAAELVARELAIVTSIPDAYLRDSGFDAEGSVEAEFAAAMAAALDRTILFGIDRPAGFPELVPDAPATGADALAAIDQALSVVESSGVQPDGIVAGPMIGSALRAAYREVMAPPSQGPEPNVFGVPLRIVASWPTDAAFDAIVGAWRYLIVGIREDVRVDRSTDGVLTNANGSIRVSAFESDVTLFRAYGRFGAAVGKPVGPSGQAITPFAACSWTGEDGNGNGVRLASAPVEGEARRGPGRPPKATS